jgi:lysophospholipase L1-like esterase
MNATKGFLLALIFMANTSFMTTEKKYTMLCLGDSYTIGEAVQEAERFPMQAVEMLNKKGVHFEKPEIIAKTGWTTDELAAAVKEKHLSGHYDFVTLLIGVNNQYRGRDIDNYRKEFNELLNTAIHYSNGNRAHVFVISIPDWGVTPFGNNDKRGEKQIGEEIDHYNATAKQEALKAKVNYIDITPASRLAKTDAALIATDGLHPSGKMYKQWAEKLVEGVNGKIR